MTQANEALVRQILGDLIDTHTGAPLGEAVRAIGVDGLKVSVDLQLGYPAAGAIDDLTARVRQALEADPAIEQAEKLLGSARFRQALTRGAGLSLEEAVELASALLP